MASNYAPSSSDASKPNRKHRFLTLNMIKEGKSCAAISRHFGVSVRTFFHIKMLECRIRKTAEITVDNSAKKIISPRYKPLILMEAALICLGNNKHWIARPSKLELRIYMNISLVMQPTIFKTEIKTLR